MGAGSGVAGPSRRLLRLGRCRMHVLQLPWALRGVTRHGAGGPASCHCDGECPATGASLASPPRRRSSESHTPLPMPPARPCSPTTAHARGQCGQRRTAAPCCRLLRRRLAASTPVALS
eukprot:357886-Chlamydomonas_euryale.AAC.4